MLRLGRAPKAIGQAKTQEDRGDRQAGGQAGISGCPAVGVDPKEFGHFETEGREGRVERTTPPNADPVAMYQSMG